MMYWRDESRLLTRYLLGESSENRRLRLEARLLADEEFYQRLLTAEDDLIHAYVHLELSASRRRRFEALFLTAPERRSRVELARELRVRALETEFTSEEAVDHSPWWLVAGEILPGHSAVPGAMALTALLITCGLFQWSESGDENGAKDEMPVASAIVSLLPTVRSEAAKIPQLKLASGISVVDLEVYLENQRLYERFQARLETLAGVVLWTSGEIESTHGTINVSVPAEIVRSSIDPGESGFYILSLEGTDSIGQDELVDEYEIEVIRIP